LFFDYGLFLIFEPPIRPETFGYGIFERWARITRKRAAQDPKEMKIVRGDASQETSCKFSIQSRK